MSTLGIGEDAAFLADEFFGMMENNADTARKVDTLAARLNAEQPY